MNGSKMIAAVCLAAALAGCAAAPALPALSGIGASYTGSAPWKYTSAEEQFIEELKNMDRSTMSLREFDRKVADWEDETHFHKSEEALERLRHSYPDDKEDSDFVQRTLQASFRESAAKHYGGTCDRVTPFCSDEAVRVRQEDVFGDAYTVFTAEAGYVLHYRVQDESKTTVAQRDGLLNDYRAAVQVFLDGKTEKQLLDQEAMEKALQAELKRLDRKFSTDALPLSDTELDYYWADGPGSTEATAS